MHSRNVTGVPLQLSFLRELHRRGRPHLARSTLLHSLNEALETNSMRDGEKEEFFPLLGTVRSEPKRRGLAKGCLPWALAPACSRCQ